MYSGLPLTPIANIQYSQLLINAAIASLRVYKSAALVILLRLVRSKQAGTNRLFPRMLKEVERLLKHVKLSRMSCISMTKLVGHKKQKSLSSLCHLFCTQYRSKDC